MPDGDAFLKLDERGTIVDANAAAAAILGRDRDELIGEPLAAVAGASVVMAEFLRNAAHQLRTPLAGITAAVETLQAGAKNRPEDRDLFLSHIQTHADRLTRLARGLLLLARARAGESVPVDAVELRPLLDRLVADAEPLTGVDLRVDCAPGLAALATPDVLQEALAALVANAVAHTTEGAIRIGAIRDDAQVVLTVADSGPGIPAEFHARVFEPFFRLTPTGEGYGLGLSIAADSVKALGGTIDVSSPPGGGTTFTVRLPSA